MYYRGAQSGWVYISLGTYGTAIPASTVTSGGAFTIRGVPPGNYAVQAWMDTWVTELRTPPTRQPIRCQP